MQALAESTEKFPGKWLWHQRRQALGAVRCWLRVLAWLVAFVACAGEAHADGKLMLRDRELFRTGPLSREYCNVASDECPVVMSKVLSSYGFLRGALRGAASFAPLHDAATHVSGFGALHLDGASAALPGGDMAVASFDGVFGGAADLSRLRLTLVDLENVFACYDVQDRSWQLPFLGMTSRHCREDAVLGVDLRLLRFQWDAWDQHLLAEWVRLGPAFELLQNGLGQAHLLRSVVLAALFDVQTRFAPLQTESSGTGLGAGVRLSAFYRTPQWESRLRVGQRTALTGPSGFGRDQRVEAELRLLRNWFATDAIVVQAGLSLGVNWASQPQFADALYGVRTSRMNVAAGLYLGWVSEAPGI